MSLIHEALEKAKQSRLEERRNSRIDLSREKGKKGSFLVVFFALFSVIVFGYFLYNYRAMLSGKTDVSSFSDHQTGDSTLYSGVVVETEDSEPSNFSYTEEFGKAMKTGDSEKLFALLTLHPDSASKEDFERVVEIYITIDDTGRLEKLTKVADSSGKLDENLMLKLAGYFENRRDKLSASLYKRAYFAGHRSPLLMAKVGTLYDKIGLADSALKYYKIYLNFGETTGVYFDIKRRFEYLANRR